MQTGRVTLITGASRGIGAAVARWLALADQRVALVARSSAPLESLAAGIRRDGGEALVMAGDIGDPEVCRMAVVRSLERWGRIDAVIHNAGVIEPIGKIADTDPAEWQANLQTNLVGAFLIARAALPSLRSSSGRAVFVSSGAANHPIAAASAYCAAKAGLNHFVRVLAAEEPTVVSVALRPGVVDTAMQERLRTLGPAAMPAAEAAYYQRLLERNQLEPPRVPARSIAWLALEAPAGFSGRFLNYDDPRVWGPALTRFGERFD